MLKALLVVIFLIGCKTSVIMGENELTLVKATQQKLYTGSKGGGVITEYNISLITPKRQALRFDSVWMNRKKFPVRTMHEDTKHSSSSMVAGDSLVLVFSAHEVGRTTVHGRVSPPMTYDGAALLRYYQEGKPKFMVVQEFVALEPVYAP